MDGLSSIFSNLGGWLSGGGNAATGATPNWTKLLTGGLLASGEVGNILSGEKQSSMQDYLTNLAKNPQIMSHMILKSQQPISGAQNQDVNNRVHADKSSLGLSRPPGIFAGTEAQALAPFEQQNYQTAQQQVLSQLGLAAGANLNQPLTSLSPALQALMRTFGYNTGTGGQTNANPAAWPVPPQTAPQPGITLPGTVYGVPPGSTPPTFPDTSGWPN